jgi:hypothetical protein
VGDVVGDVAQPKADVAVEVAGRPGFCSFHIPRGIIVS